MTKRRIRFVVEVDPQFQPPWENYSCEKLACSEGMRKALSIPERIWRVANGAMFLTGQQWQEERKAWGSSLTPFNAESQTVEQAFSNAAIVSIKISAGLGPAVDVRVSFRRHRRELWEIYVAFRPDGALAASGGGGFLPIRV